MRFSVTDYHEHLFAVSPGEGAGFVEYELVTFGGVAATRGRHFSSEFAQLLDFRGERENRDGAIAVAIVAMGDYAHA